ncbi:unnamed protein product [Adineta steineri]|uniref:EGF-like domain-containing protein n=1 Tax=Adineta steineri TaxID=433720 RepID=A0A813QZV3_9BILA|nr:unnamed protein product [Adineta steineri]CAF0906421.1 unnamed protein product [Adineta steineri]CAF1116225.1 unnamed protein product [Adineta steineri]
MVPLDNSTNTTVIVAGNTTCGPSANTLCTPFGIFIDSNFDLYVADSANHRVQLFRSGQMNAMTVTVNGTSNGILLSYPTSVMIDGNGYLYIADLGNRIIRSGPDGYNCVIGCIGTSGLASSQLNQPYKLAFDSHGNIFVLDVGSSLIQKFMLATNSCKSTTMMTSSQIIDTTVINVRTSISYFSPLSCSNTAYIGLNCSISSNLCDMLQPCQNNGTCNNTNQNSLGYICSCPLHFNGTYCQFDDRPCKPNTCINNGICIEMPNITFMCKCANGWKGDRCEIKINYCANITCLNNGVCRSLLTTYKCECLGQSYSGKYCEKSTNSLVVRKVISKSFGYIVIIALIAVVVFIMTLDILKYFFGIDPVRKYWRKLKRKKKIKKSNPQVIRRFTYVN